MSRGLPGLPPSLSRIAGTAAARLPDFGREQWTTRHVGSLRVGDVFALPGASARPVVLAVARTEEVPGEVHGWVVGEAHWIDDGAVEEFKLRANTPVLTRCDLHYIPATPEEGIDD